MQPLQNREFPKSPHIKSLLGPSFILLGLGLGSGEIILWPYLASNFGLGIIWGAVVGITFQFFIDMEIERYSLARGESVFVGLKRRLSWIPLWFIISTFIPWIWPGIIAASATLWGSVFGITNINLLSIILLIAIGVILTLGPILYKTVERLQMILISIGVPTIFLLSIFIAKSNDYISLTQGVFGIGNGYFLLPAGISMASFLAAFAYAGAAGNLNLAQSFYIKEKGYGMGKYSGRITSLISGKAEKINITGAKFDINNTNIAEFNKWWRNINIEHFLVFWLTGTVTILLLALLAYTTTFGLGLSQGINFVIAEGAQISKIIMPAAGIFFLLIAGSTLFATQLTVFDATSRILTENIILAVNERYHVKKIPLLYYSVLWLQISAGIIIFMLGFSEPLQLLIIAAVMNAFAMFVHSGLTLWLNSTSLEAPIRPNLFRKTAMIIAFLFYGGFSFYVIIDKLLK